MAINEFETLKLFYNEYLYKVTIRNPISSIFRDKNLTYAREQLDKLQLDYESNTELILNKNLRDTKISLEEFVGAKFLLTELEKQTDFKLRIESPRLSIYSNDKKWLEYLMTKPLNFTEFYSPNKANISLLAKNNIIVKDKNFGYSYKITLKDKVDSNFYKWLSNNDDKVKIGDTCLESIKNGNYVRGFYFYIRDDKVLSLIHLMISGGIARIDNLVYPAVKDK
tara:strand:- start:2029 stop:2700 length:672 start_codon:yes stop_codon:yes gene_type:complete